jgi:hypothetical protein
VGKGSKPRITATSKKAGTQQKPFDLTNANLRRERNIQAVNKQLEKAALNTSSEMAGDEQQTKDPMQKASNSIERSKRMIYPGSKDAPKFNSDSPRELRRFIRLMEDLWEDTGIADDQQKKIMIGKYADQNSEEEWAAFDTYKEGTWKEFKKELLENYPEAAAAERGTPARIRQICAETHKIVLGDMPSLYAFRRAFMAEAKKLQEEPVAMANRELVELFISCLTDSLASAVLQYLNHKPPKPKVQNGDSSNSKKLIRRPEDKYDLEDVCKAALQVSENSQGMFHLMGSNKSNRVIPRSVWREHLITLIRSHQMKADGANTITTVKMLSKSKLRIAG